MKFIIGAVAALSLQAALCYSQTPLAAPVLVEPSSGSLFRGSEVRGILFDWSNVPESATFEVDLTGPPGFSNPLGVFLPWPEQSSVQLSFSIDGLYSWRVRAFSLAGQPGQWSQSRLFSIQVREDPTPLPTATPTATPVPHPQAAFDLNQDHRIEAGDLIILAGYLHTSDANGDFNGDQSMDYRDLLLFSLRWGLDWR